jgi:hypothetical protein
MLREENETIEAPKTKFTKFLSARLHGIKNPIPQTTSPRRSTALHSVIIG